MDVSITMASFNSWELTRQALESILENTREIEYEVIVVDNASNDGSADMIEKLFPSVKIIRNDKNLGFAAAHNQALLLARGKYLLVLNSDVLFLENVVKKMVDRFTSVPDNIGIIGPQVLNKDKSLAPSSRRIIIYSRGMVALSAINQLIPFGRFIPMKLIRRYFGKIFGGIHDNFNPPAEMQEVEWVDGMCVMFRRELLKTIGLFDEQYFFDMEIGDILLRSRAAGWRIVFDPKINIIHLGGYSRRRNSRIMIESYRSLLIYYSKHKPSYVSMLRNIQMFFISMKILFLNILNTNENQRKIEILIEIKKMIADFKPDYATKNIRIPRLNI